MALVIIRKNGQKLRIGDVLVEVWVNRRNRVKLICDVPKDVQVVREEVSDRADATSEDADGGH